MTKTLCQGPDLHYLLLVSDGFVDMELLRSVVVELGQTLECIPPAALDKRLAGGVPCMILLGPDLSDETCAQICTTLAAHDNWHDCRRVLLTSPQSCSPGCADLLTQRLLQGVLGWPIPKPVFKECLTTHLKLLQARDKLYAIEGLFHNEHTVMLIIDPGSGRIVDANPGAVRFYGWSHYELCQMYIQEITTLPLKEIHQAWRRASSMEQNYFQVRHRLASGALREVEVWSGPVSRRDGAWLYSIIFDVTERNRLQQDLAQAADQALAATRAKNEFLANMSHEIRTPLNGMLGMLQVLEYTPLDEEQRHLIEMATAAGKRLTRLLADILDLSRIEAGKMGLYPSEFNLDEVRQSIIDLLFQTTTNPDLRLSFDIDPQVPLQVLGDETRLIQILFNLVGNAIKFTTQGTVNVSVHRLPHAREHIVWLLFQVIDTGPGIPDERVREIFAPFVQVETSYTRAQQGAGLGLAIVRRLVELMHGSMSVDSYLGEGTTVCVSIPFELPSAAAIQDKATAEDDDMVHQLRLLLVEDDETSLRAGQWMLEKLGHTVMLAKNGQEALDVLHSRDVDVIFMDVQMPILNGLEATQVIRSWKGPKAKVPIVALTGYTMNGDRKMFLEAGMDGHLAKPVHVRELQQVLDQVTANMD